MRKLNLGSHPRAWKASVCGLAVLGAAVIAAPVAGAAPTVPGAPTITSVKAGVRSVTVAFTKPADNGGAKITNYRVRCTSPKGKTGAHEGTKSPILVAGLTAELSYRCTVAARNTVGLGPASTPSDPVLVKATTPGAPTITSATAGVRSAKVVFTKPADDGGARISNYRVKCTSSDGGKVGAHTGARSPLVVSALSPGKTYTCTVAARNKLGLGTASAPSDPVVPLAH